MDLETNKPRINKLVGINYRTWQIQVGRMIKAQGLYGAINGRFAKILKEAAKEESLHEEEDDDDDDIFENTMVQDAKASTLIIGLCSQGPLDHIISLETAQEQWDKLKALYAPLGLQQLESKTQSFINYEPSPNATVADVSNELNTLQSEIGAISKEERPSDTMKLTILYRTVRALNTLYDPVVLQLGLAKITNYEEVIVQLMEYERRIAASGKTIKENVFSATTNRGRHNQNKLKDEDRGRKKGFSGRCYNCDKIGHRKADCRSLSENKGGRASTGPLTTPNEGRGLSPRSQDNTYYTSETSWMASTTCTEPTRDDELTWVVDSGCSRHMTYSRDVLENFQPLRVPIKINIANGTSIEAIGEGSARLKAAINGGISNVLLHNVLYVPNLAGSLISVLQLQDRGILTRTTKYGELLLELDGKIIGRDIRLGKTYTLASTVAGSDSAYNATVEDENLTWHRRFGHLGTKTLARAHEATVGLKKPVTTLSKPCETCIQNKMTRSINRQPSERASQVLGHIHTDAWGPYQVLSLTGDKYFFSFTDDHSRKSWVYVTNARAKLHDIFMEFKVKVELETGARIKAVRCDNISEYKALATKFEKDYGIQFEFTTTYTPEQNGVSERLNRSLVTVARTMLADAKLPASFWAEAIRTAWAERESRKLGQVITILVRTCLVVLCVKGSPLIICRGIGSGEIVVKRVDADGE